MAIPFLNTTSFSANITVATTGFFGGKVNVQGSPPITPNANFDDLVITDSGNAGISIFSGNANDGAIYFGDQDFNGAGQIKYLHASNSMTFTTDNDNPTLTLDDGYNATFAGTIESGGSIFPTTNGGGLLGLGNKQFSGLNLSSSSSVTWANGDASILEGEVGGYSLSFNVYNGVSALERVLLLEKSKAATFSGKVTSIATAASDGSTTLTTKSYVDGLVTGVPVYKGTWNATTNSPDLTLAAAKVLGNYYIVDTSGDFAPNGVGTDPNSWVIGDWCIFSDITSGAGTDVWQKIDNTSVISGAGTGSTLTLWAGLANADSETLTDSIITQSTGQPQIKISSTNDAQLVLHSTNTWSGIYFDDDGASPDYIFHNAGFGTFAIGGGGSNVLNKKLHVHGAQTIGVNYVSTAVPVGGLLVEGKVGIGTTNTTTGYLVLPGEESAEFKIAFTGASASSGLSTVDQSGAGLYIGANSRVNTSGVAIANNTALASNGIYFDAWNGDDIEFYTGASGNPGVRMRINTTGSIQFSNYGGTNKIGIPTYLLGTDASGNIVKADSQNGLGFAPAINFIRNGINSTTYTMIATVNGDGLSSIIQMSITGTSGNVVLNSLFDISVSHSQDIHVTSQSGDYSEVTLRITSNNNEDFSIEAKHNGSTATNAEIWIYPKAGETVTPTTVDPNFSGSEYEHM